MKLFMTTSTSVSYRSVLSFDTTELDPDNLLVEMQFQTCYTI